MRSIAIPGEENLRLEHLVTADTFGSASALAQSTDHILDFFRLLRSELGFYVACLNLSDRLVAKGEPTRSPTCTTSPTGSTARE